MNTMNLMASEELLDLIIGASMMHNGKTDFLMDIAEGLNNKIDFSNLIGINILFSFYYIFIFLSK